MNSLLAFLRFLVSGNIFIGLCAAFLSLETEWILGSRTFFTPVVLITATGTTVVYAWHRYVKMTVEPVEYGLTGKGVQITVMWLAGLMLALQIPEISVASLFLLIAGLIIALWYLKGIFFLPPLRRVPFAKSIIIAIIWTLVTVIFPLMNSQVEPRFYFLSVGRFFFLFAIALPFDIRDMETDRIQKLRTIPVMLGWNRSRWISLVSLVLFVISGTVEWAIGLIPLKILLAYVISGMLSATFISRAKPGGSFLYYGLVIDGSNLVQGLLCILAYSF